MRSCFLGAIFGLLVIGQAAAQALAQDGPATWVRKPSSDDLRAAWPAEAKQKGLNGSAKLRCEVNVLGGLENCAIDSEEPAGAGFGVAALSLVPSFQVKPKVVDGKPVRSQIRVPVAFKSYGPSSAGARGSLLPTPIWLKAPTYEDVAAAWPKRIEGIENAQVALRCAVSQDFRLRTCDVLTEAPEGKGFGAAARKLADGFELLPPGKPPKDLYVNLAVRFQNSEAGRTVSHPRWIKGLDPKKVAEIFPNTAVEKGLTEGLGVAECTVAVGGDLTGCKVAREEPAGLGFGEAAVAVAGIMQMSPWTDDGRPVDGAVIRLPIRFKKAPDAAPAN